MAPTPLTPISEESLPNFAEIKVHREDKSTDTNQNIPEDRGCLFFYQKPYLKGPFNTDPFLVNARNKYYDSVIENTRRFETDFLRDINTENMALQRNQSDQSMGLTELQDKYQIAVDVKGYAANDISVKAVGDKELMVEGKKVAQSADGTAVNQCFSRRFCLPGLVKLDSVSSALSSDGILTITAPKLHNELITSGTQNFIEPPSSSRRNMQQSSEMKTSNQYDQQLEHLLSDLQIDKQKKANSGDTCKSGNPTGAMVPTPGRMNELQDLIEEENHYKICLDTKGYSPKDISVKAVGDRELLVEGRRIEKQSSGSETSQTFSRKFCLPGLVKLDSITSSLSPEGKLTITAPKKEEPRGQIEDTTKRSFVTNTSSTQNMFEPQSFKTVPSGGSVFGRPNFDDFFADDFNMVSNMNRSSPFMEQARNDYKDSLDNMMNRDWVMEPRNQQQPAFFSNDPDLSMGKHNTTSDLIESATDYKMKLDVSNYKPEDISVKAVGDTELLVEGRHVEKQAGAPEICHSFSRRMCLPGLVKLEAVSSSLSSDGVLTITAPKLMK